MNCKYKEEAKARFGSTDAYKEFERKTAGCTEADFEASAEGLNGIFAQFAQCKAQGSTPKSPEAQSLVKELQGFITNSFYTCTDEILKGLGVMYTADERFAENIDKNGVGTAEFVSMAIEVYCG